MTASSAPNLRFLVGPPKDEKPMAAAISGSISMSILGRGIREQGVCRIVLDGVLGVEATQKGRMAM